MKRIIANNDNFSRKTCVKNLIFLSNSAWRQHPPPPRPWRWLIRGSGLAQKRRSSHSLRPAEPELPDPSGAPFTEPHPAPGSREGSCRSGQPPGARTSSAQSGFRSRGTPAEIKRWAQKFSFVWKSAALDPVCSSDGTLFSRVLCEGKENCSPKLPNNGHA